MESIKKLEAKIKRLERKLKEFGSYRAVFAEEIKIARGAIDSAKNMISENFSLKFACKKTSTKTKTKKR